MNTKYISNMSIEEEGFPLLVKKDKIVNIGVETKQPPEIHMIKVYDVVMNSERNTKNSSKGSNSSYNSIAVLNLIKQGYIPYVKYSDCIGLFKYYGYDNDGQLFVLFDPPATDQDDSGSGGAVPKLKLGELVNSYLSLSSLDPILQLYAMFVNENGYWGYLSSGSGGNEYYQKSEGSEER